MTIDNIQAAVAAAWKILFGKDTGVIPLFLAFLGENPILLLPMGFYLIIMGINSARRLIKGYWKKKKMKFLTKWILTVRNDKKKMDWLLAVVGCGSGLLILLIGGWLFFPRK